VEVIGPSGKGCGAAAFPAVQSGQFCAGSLFLGYDGTVVDGFVEDLGVTGGVGYRKFIFRWWTGFLR
jgi:hypothetical protein